MCQISFKQLRKTRFDPALGSAALPGFCLKRAERIRAAAGLLPLGT